MPLRYVGCSSRGSQASSTGHRYRPTAEQRRPGSFSSEIRRRQRIGESGIGCAGRRPLYTVGETSEGLPFSTPFLPLRWIVESCLLSNLIENEKDVWVF